jgi:hypothetical protein
MDQLAGLTFNSRAIIETLVMLAQNNSRYADIIVSCVDAHIRKVSLFCCHRAGDAWICPLRIHRGICIVSTCIP